MLERADTLERGLKLPGKSRWRPAFLSREGRSEKGPQGQDQQWKKFDDFFHKSSQNDGGSANELHPQLGSDDGDTRFAEPNFLREKNNIALITLHVELRDQQG